MTKEETELINEKFKGITTLMNSQYINLEDRLTRIELQTMQFPAKLQVLETADTLHYINCPNGVKIRTLEDNQLSNKAIKTWIAGSIAITGTVVGMVFIIFKLITGV